MPTKYYVWREKDEEGYMYKFYHMAPDNAVTVEIDWEPEKIDQLTQDMLKQLFEIRDKKVT